MLGFRYLKTTPTTHVMQYRSGKLVRQGAGLSFFYFVPSNVVVKIPLASVGVPFAFNEVTVDFQEATIQGDITYRIVDPESLAKMLDHSVNHNGRYQSDDPTKIGERLTRISHKVLRIKKPSRVYSRKYVYIEDIFNEQMERLGEYKV